MHAHIDAVSTRITNSFWIGKCSTDIQSFEICCYSRIFYILLVFLVAFFISRSNEMSSSVCRVDAQNCLIHQLFAHIKFIWIINSYRICCTRSGASLLKQLPHSMIFSCILSVAISPLHSLYIISQSANAAHYTN